MNRELLKGLTMLLVVVVLAMATAVLTANAQSPAQSPKKVIVDIPFEFSVGYKTVPAGQYSVQTVASAGNALLIQSADAKLSALRLSEGTDRLKNNAHARLVFHRYGERYFLAEVWNGADTTGRRLLPSLEERALERELANIASTSDESHSAYEIVEIAAELR